MTHLSFSLLESAESWASDHNLDLEVSGELRFLTITGPVTLDFLQTLISQNPDFELSDSEILNFDPPKIRLSWF